jgi:hypothetical protein
MKFKKFGCLVLAFVLTLPLALPVNSYAAGRFSDTAGHWAENYINTAVNQKIITGYPDGKFLPDKAVTRAEFATMVNKALGNTGSATLAFTDVPYGEWYYNDVAKALSAAYTAGYDDNTFRPNNPITRQEAAVMIARIVPAYGSGGNLKAYSDYSSIADWAYDALEKVNGKGYIGAYDDGKIHPTDQLTRAQTAKIICTITDHETIVSSSPTIKDDGTRLSGKIYSNNVTVDEALGEDSATIDNCVILGSLSVKGGGTDSITVSNSRIASATVNKDDDPVRILAKGETAIARLSASQASVLQTSGLSGGLFGPGFSNISIASSADVTLKGSFPKVEVAGARAEVSLDSGTIDALTVTGRYSDITAASGTTIDTATVNAESYFHGSGSISQMNVNADDVTYETKPKHWTIASSADTPTESDGTADIVYSPKNGATNVKLDTKVTITFDEAMELYNGNSISSSNVDDFVELRKGSSSGSLVSYTASINSAKTVITITPRSSLASDTKYYVIIDKNSIRDNDDNGNVAQSIYFTTGDSTGSAKTTFSPADGATVVPVGTSITLTFSDDVVRYSNGATISTNDSYLKDCLVFKKTNSSGDSVSYSASISSSKKVVTITPSSSLVLNQKYYVAVVGSKLKLKDTDEAIPASSVTWTTGVTTPVLNTFTVTPGDTDITATMTPNVAGKLYAVAVPSGSSAPTAVQIAAGQNSSGTPALASAKNESAAATTSVALPSLSGLASGVSYDVWATLYSNASGTYSSPAKQTATTTLPRVTLDGLTVKPIVGGTVLNDNQISYQKTNYSYNVRLNSSISSVELRAEGDSSATITIAGSTLSPTTGSGVMTATVDVAANPSVTVTIARTGSTSSSYTVSLGQVNETGLESAKIDNATQSFSGGTLSYALSTSGSAVVAMDVTAKDKYAEIIEPSGTTVTTVSNSSGHGVFNLEFAAGTDPVAIVFKIRSGSSETPYYITFTRPL